MRNIEKRFEKRNLDMKSDRLKSMEFLENSMGLKGLGGSYN